MIIKAYCWECAKKLNVTVDFRSSKKMEISVSLCPRCLKNAKKIAHLEGEIHRDRVITAKKRRKK